MWSVVTKWPKAILHIDGDSFFASCEMAMNPSLKGKPVVTGAERGIASSMSYEAKKLGISRGMPIFEIQEKFPQVIIKASDYETYSLFSQRMFAIVRRYTPSVEEYSIDECFADMTGLRRALRMSYVDMAARIKHELQTELGMTFSIGLAPTKVLAKVGSKWKKPDGLTVIQSHSIKEYISRVPIHKVWGIGLQTSAYLIKYGITTAGEFANKSEEWVNDKLTKPHQEMWRELRGESVFAVDPAPHNEYQTIGKTKTFTPPSRDRAFIFSQLSKNVENACIKARRHKLYAQGVSFFLKTQEFRFYGAKTELSYATNSPTFLLQYIEKHFDSVYRPNTLYRATGVTLLKLTETFKQQIDLFGEYDRSEKCAHVFEGVDQLSQKYGKHTVFLGSSFHAMRGIRDIKATPRRKAVARGETKRKHIGVPYIGEVR